MEIQELKEQAGDLSAKGHFAQAEVLYRQMLLLAPRDCQLWVRHAEALEALGRSDDAVATLRQALALKQDDLELISELVRMELRKPARPSARIPTPPQLLALPMLDAPPTNRGITLEVFPPVGEWPQVRRLNPQAVALQPTADARWVIIESDAALRVSFADALVDADDDDELT